MQWKKNFARISNQKNYLVIFKIFQVYILQIKASMFLIGYLKANKECSWVRNIIFLMKITWVVPRRRFNDQSPETNSLSIPIITIKMALYSKLQDTYSMWMKKQYRKHQFEVFYIVFSSKSKTYLEKIYHQTLKKCRVASHLSFVYKSWVKMCWNQYQLIMKHNM